MFSFKMLGDPAVKPTKHELINKKEFQRIVLAKKIINKGELFTDENLEMKRVSGGNGLSGKMYDKLLGMKATKNFKKGNKIEL